MNKFEVFCKKKLINIILKVNKRCIHELGIECILILGSTEQKGKSNDHVRVKIKLLDKGNRSTILSYRKKGMKHSSIQEVQVEVNNEHSIKDSSIKDNVWR